MKRILICFYTLMAVVVVHNARAQFLGGQIKPKRISVAGSISSFNCSGAAPSPQIYAPSVSYTGTVSLGYTGGNGGTYAAGSVSSTGVTGFTASWSAGTLAVGSGSITINISGSASRYGTASFAVTIAGGSCTLLLGSCGAYIASGVWKPFLCHNLGADTTLDPNIPVVGLQGAYIQWGRRGPNTTGDSRRDWIAATATSNFGPAPTSTNPNAGAISGWSSTDAPNYSWLSSGGSKTANDPCPAGYHVPTNNEWSGVDANNTQSMTVASWTSGATNYDNAAHFGPSSSVKSLTLPMAGTRDITDGSLADRGGSGSYWSSTESSSGTGTSAAKNYLVTPYGNFTNQDGMRLYGMSIRCIAD